MGKVKYVSGYNLFAKVKRQRVVEAFNLKVGAVKMYTLLVVLQSAPLY